MSISDGVVMVHCTHGIVRLHIHGHTTRTWQQCLCGYMVPTCSCVVVPWGSSIALCPGVAVPQLVSTYKALYFYLVRWLLITQCKLLYVAITLNLWLSYSVELCTSLEHLLMVGNNYCSNVMITPYVDSSIITVDVTHSLPVTVKACMIYIQ